MTPNLRRSQELPKTLSRTHSKLALKPFPISILILERQELRSRRFPAGYPHEAVGDRDINGTDVRPAEKTGKHKLKLQHFQ